ncbi:MAG: EAL domain-containing protein [Rhodocyclaceae bacterium]|nr:EAL domain-containing protein [Rhodocyclaceae bacterium]
MLTRIQHSIRHSSWGAAVVSAIIAVGFSAVPAYFASHYQEMRQEQLAQEAERHLASRIGYAQELIERAKQMPGIVALSIPHTKAADHFETTVRNLLRMSGIVSSVKIEPLQGESIVIQRELSEQSEPIALPLPAVAGLTAQDIQHFSIGDGSLLVTQPLWQPDNHGGKRLWGRLVGEASLAYLIQELQLLTLINDGFGVKFSLQWQSGAPETVIFSGGALNNPGTTRSVPLVGNEILTLHIAPPSASLIGFPLLAGIGIALSSVLLFFLTFHLLLRPQKLERKVAERTRELLAEQAALREAMDARIRAEAHLEQSHALLDSIFEHTPGMIVLKRVSDLRITRINSSGERILGRERTSLIGRSNDEIYAPELADVLDAGDKKAIRYRSMIELPVQKVDMLAAEPRWISYRKTTLCDSHGVPLYVLEFGEDVTERENLERHLRESLHFLEQLIEAFPGPVFSKNIDGQYLAVNKQFEKYVGRNRQQIVGKTIHDVVPGHFAVEEENADRNLLSSGDKQIYEGQLKQGDGRVVDAMFHKAVFRYSDGSNRGIVGIALDISERKAAEQRVASLNRVLMVLSEINHLIIFTQDRTALLEQARRILQEKGGFPAVWIHFKQGDSAHVFADDSIRPYVERLRCEIDNPDRRCWPQRRLRCDTLACCNAALSQELNHLGLQSLLHLPLQANGTERGDIGILGASGQIYSTEEQALLEELAGNLSFALDAIDREEARQTAEGKLRVVARVFENSSEGIIIADERNRIIMVNKAFTALTGYTTDEVVGNTPAMLSSGRSPPHLYRHMWESLNQNGEWQGEVVNRRKNGEEYLEWLSISVLKDDTGKTLNYVAAFSDISIRRQIEERVHFLTHHDALTSLPNRDHFLNRVQQAIVETEQQNTRMAVVYLDLDRFKLVNETVGQASGDQILIEISSRLLAIADSKADVSRLGGDQFALVMKGLATSEEAAQRVRNVQEKLHGAFEFADQEIYISTSIGISVFPEDGIDAEALARNADSAMYKAIADGGNTYRFFRQEMNERAAERVRLESKLHHALERGELIVNFQPFVSAVSGRIVGAEALLRWHCPDLEKDVGPAVFIPLLEEIGLIQHVGEWVINKACEEVRRWQLAVGEELFVAVNISAMQLNGDIVRQVARAVAEHGIAPAQLEIELTESAVMSDAAHGIKILNELKTLGVGLSIDDFGTGYSSLSYLKQLPMKTLKIDRSFVSDTPEDSEAASIARAILALGHSLKLNIIAEGVETLEQVEFLRESGCDLLQGYYFSKPLPGAEFVQLLKQSQSYDLPEVNPRTLHLTRTRLH